MQRDFVGERIVKFFVGRQTIHIRRLFNVFSVTVLSFDKTRAKFLPSLVVANE